MYPKIAKLIGVKTNLQRLNLKERNLQEENALMGGQYQNIF